MYKLQLCFGFDNYNLYKLHSKGKLTTLVKASQDHTTELQFLAIQAEAARNIRSSRL